MMIRVLVVLLLLVSPALAQQQPDTAFMQQALVALQQQRNTAMDSAAEIQAKSAVEIAKLKARIEELEKPVAPPKAD